MKKDDLAEKTASASAKAEEPPKTDGGQEAKLVTIQIALKKNDYQRLRRLSKREGWKTNSEAIPPLVNLYLAMAKMAKKCAAEVNKKQTQKAQEGPEVV